MTGYVSAKEAAKKWNISQRRVSVLCGERRIDGAVMVGNMWIIPSDACVTKYCEPMVGGGALFFNVLSKRDFEQYYISDINAELINAYSTIKSDVDGLIEKLKELSARFFAVDESDKKLYYYSIRDKFNGTKLCEETSTEKAAYFIFLNKTCFNGLYRVNREGKFNVPMGAYKNPKICDEENLRIVSEALHNVTIVCGDYSLAERFIDKNTFVYLDPPYRPISKTSDFTSYNSHSFDDGEQIRLAKFADEINARGAKAYEIKRVSAARMINSKPDGRGKINELLIGNRGV